VTFNIKISAEFLYFHPFSVNELCWCS